jgi:hypothetical protein
LAILYPLNNRHPNIVSVPILGLARITETAGMVPPIFVLFDIPGGLSFAAIRKALTITPVSAGVFRIWHKTPNFF